MSHQGIAYSSPETHRKFLTRLEVSEQGVFLASLFFRTIGYHVTLGPKKHADKHENYLQGSDSGDIYLSRTVFPRSWKDLGRVEAKKLTYDFTCLEDWPFGQHFAICSRTSWKRATDPILPRGYFIINAAGSHYGWVATSTRNLWYEKEIRDGGRGTTRTSLFIHPQHVRFGKLFRDEDDPVGAEEQTEELHH